LFLIIVPCFNEAKRWNQEYWTAMLQIPRVQWLFVDDGSSDTTSKLLSEVSNDQNASYLRLPINAGKGEAVRAGMNTAFEGTQSYLGVGFLDADGAFEVSEVANVIEKSESAFRTEKYDAFWTARVHLSGRNIQRSHVRHYLGRCLATIFSFGVIAIPYDTQCGFKIFSVSPQLKEILNKAFGTRWLFELEMLSRWIQVNNQPMAVWEEPLGSWKEIDGSKITFREVRRITKEVVQIKVIQRRALRR